MEYKTKDTVKLSGLDYNTVTAQETGKDKVKDIGSQTKNGLSVRSLMTILHFIKALAYFRINLNCDVLGAKLNYFTGKLQPSGGNLPKPIPACI